MNTEKIEKLKKGLTNSQIPESLREKIRQQISRLEAEDKANEPVTKAEIQKIEDKIEDAVEVAEKKEATAKVAKARTARTPRAKKVVEPKARTARKPRAKKVVEPKTTTGTKNTAMSLAKEIRKEGEKWSDAVKRAGTQMKKGNTEIKKSTNTELKKLLALVKTRKELKGISGTNLKRDSKRKAKPLGKRVSEDGNVYYEYRDNRTDRLAPNYPKNAPLLAGGGSVDKVKIRDWYMKTYPTDELGKELDRNSTFEDVWTAINNGTEIYSVFGVGDSLIRERIFEKLSKIYKVDYNYVYKKWLDTDYYSDGGGVNNLPTSLKTRLKNLKGRVTISKAQALKAYELHSERGMGGSTIGYEMFDAKNKRDSETFGDLAIDLGRHYSKLAGGGGVDLSDDKYKYDLMDIGQFSLPENVRKSDAEYYKIGKEVVEKEYDGNLDLAYNMVVRLGNKERFADGGGVDGIEEDIDMTDDYVLRVNKGVQPKDRASMKDWMGKTNESREAMAYELGGATMQYDLAGNTGGGTAGLNANMPLSGVSGTQYTDLVGETGALSSGEMFDGGGRVKNEELISYETFLITEKNDYDKAIDSLIVQINKSLSKKGMPPITTKVEFDKESEYQERVYVDDNVMIRIWSIKKTPKGYNLEVSVFKEHFAKGGGIRKVGNREYPLGRNWTNDHNQVNKSEEHETSYNRKGFFATGGAVMANQQIIADASQQYVNYYLGEGASTGMFKDGGAIKNQYAGRTPRDIWNNLSIRQRMHFLHDHEEEILEEKKLRYFTDNDLVELIHSDWFELDYHVQNAFAEHTSRGEYAGGGGISNLEIGDIVTIIKPFPNADMTGQKAEVVEISKNNTGVVYISVKGRRIAVLADYVSKDKKYNNGGKMHDYKQMEDNYARGGGIRTINGREYSTGRNWTNDHKHHNKMQDYEVPMSKRR